MENTLTQPIANNSWFNKFFESLYAVIAFCSASMFLIPALLSKIIPSLAGPFRDIITTWVPLAGLVFCIVFSIYWQHKQKHGGINSAKIHARLLGLMRYWLAFIVSVYGFAKIFKTQFATLYYRDSMLVGDLSGFSLTWTYFNHSYTLAVILASLQIGGGILLLFRRTTLLGIFTLLPVMFNIVLINIFYNIDPGAFVVSLLITTALVYLLFLHRKKVIAFFFTGDEDVVAIKSAPLKWIFKILSVGLAVCLIYSYVYNFNPAPFTGKWKVTKLIRNRKAIDDNAWITDKKAYKTIYIEEDNNIGFVPNPYIYEDERADWADFTLDAKKDALTLKFETDTILKQKVNVAMSKITDSTMRWNMIYKKDTLQLELLKVKKKRK